MTGPLGSCHGPLQPAVTCCNRLQPCSVIRPAATRHAGPVGGDRATLKCRDDRRRDGSIGALIGVGPVRPGKCTSWSLFCDARRDSPAMLMKMGCASGEVDLREEWEEWMNSAVETPQRSTTTLHHPLTPTTSTPTAHISRPGPRLASAPCRDWVTHSSPC